ISLFPNKTHPRPLSWKERGAMRPHYRLFLHKGKGLDRIHTQHSTPSHRLLAVLLSLQKGKAGIGFTHTLNSHTGCFLAARSSQLLPGCFLAARSSWLEASSWLFPCSLRLAASSGCSA